MGIWWPQQKISNTLQSIHFWKKPNYKQISEGFLDEHGVWLYASVPRLPSIESSTILISRKDRTGKRHISLEIHCSLWHSLVFLLAWLKNDFLFLSSQGAQHHCYSFAAVYLDCWCVIKLTVFKPAVPKCALSIWVSWPFVDFLSLRELSKLPCWRFRVGNISATLQQGAPTHSGKISACLFCMLSITRVNIHFIHSENLNGSLSIQFFLTFTHTADIHACMHTCIPRTIPFLFLPLKWSKTRMFKR